jgi:hypothetical protein
LVTQVLLIGGYPQIGHDFAHGNDPVSVNL